ncbi:MAG: histidine kinase [Lachnospiraceae bacterium]|nr:histidine kinase [Lachnospiraceae bacterium]
MNHKKPTKLQNRFFITYLAMAGSVLLLFSVFFYKYVSNILIEQETKSLTDLTSSFMEQTDNIVKDMDSVSINLNYSSAIKSLLGKKDLDLSASLVPEFTDLCVTINGAENKVDQINLYDYSGNVLKVGLTTNFTTVEMNQLEWIEQTKIYGGSKLLSIPYVTKPTTRYPSSSDWYLSLYRSYYNAYGRNVGALETVKRCKSVFKNIISYNKKNPIAPDVYVYNNDGVLLFPYTEEDTNHIHNYFNELDSESVHASFTNPITKRSEIFTSATSSYTGWTYITVQAESVILQPVNQLLTLLFAVIASIMVASVLVSLYVSHSLIRPIKQLKHEVKHTGLDTLGNISSVPLTNSFEELEELNETFQTMRKNLKMSMDDLIDTRQQELKSRTLALQSQINPHFYYNSLASVIVLAENEQSVEVIKMCRNLTNIMRYITDTSSFAVTIKEEMDYISKYLYCMKIRYQTSLNYMIDIDPKLLNERIPKLIIQPLVENAIKYGTDRIPPWGIAIHGKIYDDYWQIDVMDSGNGFSPESIALIEKRINEASQCPGMPEMQINGMGMLNVYLRWKLYCESDMIFKFENTLDGHGIVSIGRKIKKEDPQDDRA